MGFFCRLRLFQRKRRIGEIGTAVLHVLVQKQTVEIVGQVIVMRDIGAGAFGCVALNPAPQRVPGAIGGAHPCRQRAGIAVAQDQPDQRVDVVVFDDQAFIHIRLAQGQIGACAQPAQHARIADTDADRFAAARPEVSAMAVGIGDAQLPVADQTRHHPVKNRLPHRFHPAWVVNALIQHDQ